METLPPIDDLWDFSDPAATEERLLGALKEVDDESYRAEVMTQIARTMGLRGQFDRAHEVLDGVASVLPRVSPRVEVRYLLERGRAWNSAGARDRARELFLSAFDAAKRGDDDFLTIDAAHMLGIVEEPAASIEWNLLGFRLVEESKQERARTWMGALANNIGWTYHDIGEFETALGFFEKGLEYRRLAAKEPGLRIARWAVARCKRSLGRLDEALEEQLAIARDYSEPDCFVHEETGECLYAMGRASEAEEHFSVAYELLSKLEWLSKSEPDRLARLEELSR